MWGCLGQKKGWTAKGHRDSISGMTEMFFVLTVIVASVVIQLSKLIKLYTLNRCLIRIN